MTVADLHLLGNTVPLSFLALDSAGDAVSPSTATLTITLPDGTTATPSITEDADTTGLFELDYVPASAGGYSAVLATTGPAWADSRSFVVVSGALYPLTLAEAKSYLGDVTATDAQVAQAVTVEQAAQARRCRVDDFGPDLRDALLRRVARNLAAGWASAQFSSFDGVSTGARVTATDPEIERLERPYLRWAVR